ncbi:MAG: metallophosphoesterase family protein [Spirochaetaceae bacterium]|nr:metallophosphoesterase family protein [Spirochaetaceae bacterium]
MKIIAISDIHNNYSVIGNLGNELAKTDIIIIAGDITHFGSGKDAEKIINEIEKYNKKIFAVSGNCDKSEIEKYLKEKNISVHKEIKNIPEFDINILGFGGSLTTPVPTPNTCSEDEYKKYLETIDITPDIFVSHQPPIDTIADMIPNGKHVGSFSLREFIDTKQPALYICGHIHESIGKEYYGKTLVVNPGPLKDGFYALIKRNASNEFSAELKNILSSR